MESLAPGSGSSLLADEDLLLGLCILSYVPTPKTRNALLESCKWMDLKLKDVHYTTGR